MPGKREFFYPFLFFLLVILILVGITWANFHYLSPYNQLRDFQLNWNGAHNWLFKGESPYINGSGFFHPFISMIIWVPFGLLDNQLATALWHTTIEVCLVLITLLSINISGWKLKARELPYAILFGLLWYYGARVNYLGELTPLILILFLTALYLLLHKQDSLAGFVLSLTISMPSFSLLFLVFSLVWSLAARRYQFLISLMAGLAFLGVISIILLPEWPVQWLRVAIGNIKEFNWWTSLLSLSSNAIPGVRLPLSVALNGSLLILLIVRWISSLKNANAMLIWMALFTLSVNLLLRFKSDSGDMICLVPIFCYIFKVFQDRWSKAASLAAILSGITLSVIPWLLALTSPPGGSGSLRGLPVFLAGLSLAGILWIRWWAHRPPQLPFDRLRERIG